MAQRPVVARRVVDDRAITTLSWGSVEQPAIVLVHGGAAHAWWWGFVAPLLARSHHVVALDLSGHGDSDRRDRYSFPAWAREVAAVAHGLVQPVVVGHSMGGVVAAMTGDAIADIGGVVLVDAPLGMPDRDAIGDSEAAFRRVRPVADRQHLVDRFRPLPEQPVEHPVLASFVAERSVASNGEGWAWKFDPAVFATPAAGRPQDCSEPLAASGVAVGAIVGERSPVVPQADRRRLQALTGARGGDCVILAGGHHHLMFDQPRKLAATIDRLAARLRAWTDGAG